MMVRFGVGLAEAPSYMDKHLTWKAPSMKQTQGNVIVPTKLPKAGMMVAWLSGVRRGGRTEAAQLRRYGASGSDQVI